MNLKKEKRKKEKTTLIGEKGKLIHGKNWRKKSRDTVSLNNDYCDYAECCTKYNECPESEPKFTYSFN